MQMQLDTKSVQKIEETVHGIQEAVVSAPL